jgi:hypothetical protein
MRSQTLRRASAMLVLLAGCGGGPGPVATSPSVSPAPTASPEKQKLCQPFPDRLFDGFLDAYRGRDLEALQRVVTAAPIVDPSAIPHAGTATFDGIAQWAEVGWSAGDHIDASGYSVFSPTPQSFQLLLTRTNAPLAAEGIAGLSFTLDAHTSGCAIDRLELSGPVIAQGSNPCAFYETFGDHPEAASFSPECADGSGRFAREGHVAVWTGSEMLVFGGSTGADRLEDGLAFQPHDGVWSSIPPPATEHPFFPSAAVWADREAFVVGSSDRGKTLLLRYDPRTSRWHETPPPPRTLAGATAVWTGDELLLWGGAYGAEPLPRDGAAFDPAADRWRTIPPAPIGGRTEHVAVWTGGEMLVWGGGDYDYDLADGAAYDPATNSWRTLAPTPISPRDSAVAVWTGTEMIVTGGTHVSNSRNPIAAYDPATDRWRGVADPPIDPRHWHTVVWTGEEVILWGGYDDRHALGNGAAYDPDSDRWRTLAPSPLSARCRHTAVWTGDVMVVFGGYPGCGSPGHLAFGDAATYAPETDTWSRIVPELELPS